MLLATFNVGLGICELNFVNPIYGANLGWAEDGSHIIRSETLVNIYFIGMFFGSLLGPNLIAYNQ